MGGEAPEDRVRRDFRVLGGCDCLLPWCSWCNLESHKTPHWSREALFGPQDVETRVLCGGLSTTLDGIEELIEAALRANRAARMEDGG